MNNLYFNICNLAMEVQADNKQLFEEQLESLKQTDNIESQFTQSYFDLLKINNNPLQLKKEQLIHLLEKDKILFNDAMDEQFSIQIINCTANCQLMTIRVFYTRFIFQINLINFQKDSTIHQIQNYDRGSFGTVYKAQFNKQHIAIKCHTFSENSFSYVFVNVVKQYCTMAIASALQVGAFNNKAFKFDLLVYKECIQFSMQFCRFKNMYNQKISKDLIQALQKMHKIKLIHFDIKPQNICFSKKKKKFVYIDFGLSKLIKQNHGYKTKTSFRGSLCFCSKQMENCYLNGQPAFIDLYFNDAIGLIQALKICQINQELSLDFIDSFIFTLNQYYFLVCCKFYLFKQKSEQFIEYILYQIKISSVKKIGILRNLIYLFGQSQILASIYLTLAKINDFEQQANSIRLNSNNNIVSKINDQEQYDELIDENSQFYKNRFRLLKNMQKTKTKQKQEKQDLNLIFDLKKIEGLEKDKYYRLLSHFIQINTNYLNFDQKIKAVKIFYQSHQIIIDQKISETKLFDNCIINLFDYSTSQPLSIIKMEISLNTFLSIILFQLKEQKQIIEYLNTTFISREINTNWKIKIALNCLLSVCWLSQKYKTNYNQYRLTETIYEMLSQALPKLLKNQQSNQALLLFNRIINYQLSIKSQTNLNNNIFSLLFDLKDNFKIYDVEFIQEFQSYMLYLCYWNPLRKICEFQDIFYKNCKAFNIHMRNKKANQFLFIYFLNRQKIGKIGQIMPLFQLFLQFFPPRNICFKAYIQINYIKMDKKQNKNKSNIDHLISNFRQSNLKQFMTSTLSSQAMLNPSNAWSAN